MSFDASHEQYGEGVEFEIGRIDLVGNTGTYLDTPAHRYRGDWDLAGLPLEIVADIPGVVVRCRDFDGRAIGPGALERHEVEGHAVLFETGWDRHWDTEAYGGAHPFLSAATAEVLAAAGATVVGIDSVNIDDAADLDRPVHTRLLAAGIPIVEHLTGLDGLPDHGFRFTAVPPRIAGLATFPVRAFAVVDDLGHW